MVTILWCLKKKGGMEFIEPSSNLADAYLNKAQDYLESLYKEDNRDWKSAKAYYTMYFSLYSVFMKIGVKCEIHSCSLEFMKQFLSYFFTEEDFGLISDAFRSRVDAQYYVNRIVTDEVYEKTVAKAPYFMLKCKNIAGEIDEKKIEEIRKNVKNY